jgi:hypothetical protein
MIGILELSYLSWKSIFILRTWQIHRVLLEVMEQLQMNLQVVAQ